MPPEALAPAQCPDARDPAAAEVRDAEGLLASARETAMEKLRRRRRVQKRREEKAVASVRDARKGEAAAAPGAFEERPNRPLIERVVSDQVPRHVPHLHLRAVVTPGRLVADTSGDGVTNAVAARGEPPKTKTRAGVTAAAAIGDAMACGTEDGDVVAYCVRHDVLDGARHQNAERMRCPRACGDAGPVRLIHPVETSGDGEKKLVVVAYDSGAWCVLRLSRQTLFREEKNRESLDESLGDCHSHARFSLALVTACPPHVAFSDAYKHRKRTPWAPARRPSLGAALADARGETLFVASPVVGDSNAYAWDVRDVLKNAFTCDETASNPGVPAIAVAPTATDTGRLAVLRKHTDKVTCLAFLDARETRVVSGGNDKALVEWRRETKKNDEKKTPLRPDTSSTPCGGGDTSSAHDEHDEHVWVPAKRVVAPGGAIRALCVSRGAGADRELLGKKNAARVYTAGSDGAVRAWEVSDETRGFVLLRTFLGGHGGFGVCVFAIRLPKATSHDLPARRELTHGKAEEEDAADASEEYVLSGCECPLAGGYWVEGDGSLKLWRAADGRCAQTVTLQKGNISAIVRETAGDGGDAGATRAPRGTPPTRPDAFFCRLAVASTDGTVAHFHLGTRGSISGSISGARDREKKDDVDVVAKRDGDASLAGAGADGDGRPASFAWTPGFL